MQITEPGKYRMRNGGVAEVTTLRDGYVLGYKEAWAGKSGVHTISGLWARSTGYNFCQRDSDLIARIYGSDDSQPSKDSEQFGRVLAAQGEARELALEGEHNMTNLDRVRELIGDLGDICEEIGATSATLSERLTMRQEKRRIEDDLLALYERKEQGK